MDYGLQKDFSRSCLEYPEMSTWLVVAVTVAYAYTAIEQGMKGNMGTCIMFGGYCVANVGIIKMMS